MNVSQARVFATSGLALLLAASFGCVTSGTYEELEAERDRISAQRDELALRNDALEGELVSVATRLEASEQRIAELTVTYDSLVGELQTEVASGQIEIQQVFDGIQLNVSEELLFPSGSASLNEEGQALIVRVASKIEPDKAVIDVVGHTDNVRISPKLKARYPTNWELAGARAATVVRALSEAGIPPESLRAVSRGPFAPVASNDTAEGRAKNRRTEIVLRPIPREG